MNQHHPRVIQQIVALITHLVIPQEPRDVREKKKEKWKRKQQKKEALLKTQASVVPFLFEDGCSFADVKEAIAKRQSQGKQHAHDDKFTLFYEQSGFDVTLDSDRWEAFLYHIRSLEDKTVILKVITSNRI